MAAAAIGASIAAQFASQLLQGQGGAAPGASPLGGGPGAPGPALISSADPTLGINPSFGDVVVGGGAGAGMPAWLLLALAGAALGAVLLLWRR